MIGILPRMGLVAAAVATLGLASGCTKIRDHKGYIADSTLTDAIQPGVDNRDSVLKTWGRPSFTGQFDGDSNWYYLSRDTRSLAFSNPKAIAQTVLAVRFDAAGNVVRVDRTGLDKVVAVSPDGDKTPTLGRKRGFFGELFGNIGRVGAVGEGGGTTDNPN